MAFPADLLSDYQHTAPDGADSAIAFGGGVDTFGDWVELDPDISHDSILTGMVILHESVTIDQWYEGQIGIDETTAIATFRGYTKRIANSSGASGIIWHPSVIGIDAIPANSQLCGRVRWGSSNTTAEWYLAATYLKKPLTGSLLSTTSALKVISPGAALSATTGGSAWTFGTEVEIKASSVGDPWYLTKWVLYRLNGGADIEVRLRTGAGAEIARWGHETGAPTNRQGLFTPIWTPFTLPASTQILVSVRSNVINMSVDLGFDYVDAVS
jgi:hypothetical protein